MEVSCAADFLQMFGAHFSNEEVRNWAWMADDDDAGKRVSWLVGQDPTVEVVASVELMESQLQLTVTERGLSTSSEDVSSTEAEVLLDALLQFEERTVMLDGEPLPYTLEVVTHVIRQFGERS